jgi:carboxyl-terminal processing protease
MKRFARTAAAIGVFSIAGVLTMPSASVSAAEPASIDASAVVSPSPSDVWNAARNGDSETLSTLLDPNNWNSNEFGESLVQSLERLRNNQGLREENRAEQIEEASTELDEHLAEYDESASRVALSKALGSAVGLQLLYENDDDFFSDPRVQRVLELGDQQAHAAEDEGDWIIASELYYRLDAIFDPNGPYKADTDRLNQRLTMIRMYTPERLWELRNERRLAEELDGLPPYNAYGDDYHEKLMGINSVTVRTAIQRAATQHVGRKTRQHPDGVTMNSLILGGLQSVRTMATTNDLKAAFPELGDEQKLASFLAVVDEQIARIEHSDRTASAYDLRRAVDAVIGASSESVNILEAALLHEFGNGAMGELDPYTAIIWPDEIARFSRSTQGEFIGVGIQIQLDELQNIKVVTPLEGTPAQRAGIRSGDIIKKIDGLTAVGLGLDQAVEIITGPSNTKVTLTVERTDEETDEVEELDFTVVRKRIDLPSVKGWSKIGPADEDWNYMVDPEAGIGYVRLTGFTNDTTADFDKAVLKMKEQGLNALILDLRYNPGGLLDQAVSMASRFVPEGMIVKTVDASGSTQEQQDARRVNPRLSLTDIPVVVLVNEGSASASEILSGSIQAAARQDKIQALVVGQRSFGKGSVQNVYMLPGGAAAMKVTTHHYRVDSPRMVHKVPGATEWGIEPDLAVAMLPSQQADALLLRRDADVLPLDENGEIIEDADRPDPNSLITDGTDLQVETALVLLQTQAASKLGKPAALND